MKPFLVAIRSLVAITTVVLLGLGEPPTFAADSEAAGRKHAAKANQLAAKNKCKPAVVEFTKAIKSLKDPVLLFNRAECQRKLGHNADALTDYQQFLADMPEAPNRASVEARIASLKADTQVEAAALSRATGTSPALPENPQPSEKTSAAPAHQPSEKTPPAPAQRAEKWTD